MTSVDADGNARGGQAFDLNIVKVLDHWSTSYAVREIIANALDEAALTGTAAPQIFKSAEGTWQIRDFGRGLRYQHLTQNESAEKRDHGSVIGQFGMGLKDALAVFDRRDVTVRIFSAHGDITVGKVAKVGFGDVVTLHAIVAEPTDPAMIGTSVELDGLEDCDVDKAKAFFLAFSEDTLLEETRYGAVHARRPDDLVGRIYVRGLLVAEEEKFLHSYNITELTAALRRALNRERTNVGRTAYSSRVKDILLACSSAVVANPLANDLAVYSAGTMHDELAWREVAIHACRVLQTHGKVLFVTAHDLEESSPQITYAKDDGYRLVTLPDDIARSLGGLQDLSGNPLIDLNAYRAEWNDSFTFTFVDPSNLTAAEQKVFALAGPVATLAGISTAKAGVKDILVSETMRVDEQGSEFVGLYERNEQRIVIRRDQLAKAEAFCGTLLHELAHAVSGQTDATLGFEQHLTELLGKISAAGLANWPSAEPVSTIPI